MRNQISSGIANDQYVFMEDRVNMNAIFTLNSLIERNIQVQKDTFLCFVDYKALDKMKRRAI